MVPGDGAQEEDKGKEIVLDGSFTVPGCITACSKREGVNGITTSKYATDKVKGECYCEQGMKRVNLGGQSLYKTCYLKAKVSKICSFYLVFESPTGPSIFVEVNAFSKGWIGPDFMPVFAGRTR